MKHWIAVACAEHVRKARTQGFMQLISKAMRTMNPSQE